MVCTTYLPLRELCSRGRQGKRGIGRDQLFEVGQCPGSQRCQSQHHTHHTQRGDDGGTHPCLRSSHSVYGCCTNRSYHKAKAEAGRHGTDGNLRPVNMDRPATHQVETSRGEEQAQHCCEATTDTAAQPATE